MSKEKQLTDLFFFISSTYLDLKPYREAVINKIKSEAGIINAQEFFGARDQKPIETCIQEVEKSNVFIMFKAFDRAHKDECEAFSMTYGSTLKREFKSMDEDISKVLAYSLTSIYAQDDLAEKFVAFPDKSQLTVTVRTIQGASTWREPIYKYEEVDNMLTDPLSINSAYAVSLLLQGQKKRKEKVLSHYESHEKLFCGLELIEIVQTHALHNNPEIENK